MRRRSFVYVVSGPFVGALGATVSFAGWLAAGILSVTPLVVPVLVAFDYAVRKTGDAERALARRLLGVELVAERRPVERGFWKRGLTVLREPLFWKEQTFAVLRFVLGGALAIVELTLVAGGGYEVLTPVLYRWVPMDIGSWHTDSLSRALLFVPVGVAAIAVGIALLRPQAALWRRLARTLLRSSDAAREVDGRRALAVHAAVAAGVNAVTTAIWAISGRGYFWPEWTLLPLGLVLAVHAWVIAARRFRAYALAVDAGVLTALGLFLTLVWAVTGAGYFWPVWTWLAFAIVFGVHVLFVVVRGAERIEVLETTRAGAVDVQESELRRIERDLHDGAQARLVALGMSLGMAEQKLAADPGAAAELVAEARQGAQEALRELRDLARGIHPPVLADRGLGAAIAALADRNVLSVSVEDSLDRRPAATVETAAYFVAAEALTNAAKHARASRVDVRIARDGDTLVLEVEDDGVGGANAAGSGLAGIRRRVEALDGTFRVRSPEGGPTVVRAELPCAS
ncbi:MAG TPA: sensor histidine kinase [Gaiellaceae bacterium]|nr:sensor histidine kinase [Gaiellaceae bacterium]